LGRTPRSGSLTFAVEGTVKEHNWNGRMIRRTVSSKSWVTFDHDAEAKRV